MYIGNNKKLPAFRGTVRSSSMWAWSLPGGSLLVVLWSRFSPNMPVGPVVFGLVSCISIVFGSNVSKILAIDPKSKNKKNIREQDKSP